MTFKFVQPDFTTQQPSEVKTNIEAAVGVMARLAAAFAPHAQDTPDMTVRIDAGMIYTDTALTEIAAQSTGTITAPSTNPRIDRVVVDTTTGTVSVITGTEAASPVAPAITTGKIPICQVLLDNSPATTAITNTEITDERSISMITPAAGGGGDFETGDAKLTYQTAADDGWVLADDGSIGNASSGASNRANADTADLFALMWDNMSDSECPVSSGRGASAAADFAANKNLTIPIALGHALGISGSGAGMTARTLGDTVGTETQTLTTANLASHTHQEQRYTSGSSSTLRNQSFGSTASPSTSLMPTTAAAGSGTGHNNMQPTTFLNIMIKL